MKTGLISFHFAHHYGAQLQAYALMKAINKVCGECEIINYELPHTKDTNKLFEKKLTINSCVKNLHTLANYQDLKKRYDRFQDFVKQNMCLTKKTYETFEELKNENFDYDNIVCGSDQIWNPLIYSNKRFDPAFFIDFDKKAKKVAYAPSFGISQIPNEHQEELKGYLENFSNISVREKQGQAIIKEVFNDVVPVVLDPTLLLTGEEWGKVASKPYDEKGYILCYFVSNPDYLSDYVDTLKTNLNVKCLQLAGTRRKLKGADKVIFDAGPKEFLSLFKNASYVVTNSFHGAVFSVLFKKPFISGVSPVEIKEPQKSRIGSLFMKLGLTDRLVSSTSTVNNLYEVDYESVYKRLEKEREFGLGYLKKTLNDTTE